MSLCSPDTIHRGERAGDVGDWCVDERPEPVTFEEFEAVLSTGDLFFEFGTSTYSRIIEWLGRTQYSHVGIFDVVPGVGTWIYESVRHADCTDAFTGRKASGVRTVALVERLLAMAGKSSHVKIGVVRLACTNEARGALSTLLHTCEKNIDGLPYERQLLELGKAAFPHLLGRPTNDQRTMFCSELVMRTLVQCGVLRAHGPDGNPTCCAVELQQFTTHINTLPYRDVSTFQFEPKMTVFYVLKPGLSRPPTSVAFSPLARASNEQALAYAQQQQMMSEATVPHEAHVNYGGWQQQQQQQSWQQQLLLQQQQQQQRLQQQQHHQQLPQQQSSHDCNAAAPQPQYASPTFYYTASVPSLLSSVAPTFSAVDYAAHAPVSAPLLSTSTPSVNYPSLADMTPARAAEPQQQYASPPSRQQYASPPPQPRAAAPAPTTVASASAAAASTSGSYWTPATGSAASVFLD